ncbi:transposase [Streptomyces sp. JNUCC 63]
MAVEQGQKPLSLLVTAGQRHDSPQFQPVLEGIRVPRTGRGRPRTRPDKVRADKAYGPEGTAPICADAASAAPSRRRPTRSATARSSAPAAAVRRSSTRPITRSATPSR